MVGEHGLARGFVGWLAKGMLRALVGRTRSALSREDVSNIGTGQMARREINLGMIFQRQTS